jgi:hypothetical protein
VFGILVKDDKRREEQSDGMSVMRRSQLGPTIYGLEQMEKTFVEHLVEPT